MDTAASLAGTGAAFAVPPSFPLNRSQRRALASPTAARRNPVLRDKDLTDLAFAKLTERLASYGNVLTAAHREALYCVLGRFTHLSNGHKVGRWGYALPCGSGKTEAAKAWCWALWKLRKPYSVAISASKVEALCEIKRGLIALGVPESAIGLSHSYKHEAATVERCQRTGDQLPNGIASLPCTTDNEARPIVLLTHNKIRGQREGDRLPKFNGKARSLLIYDESLLISDTWTLSMLKLDQAKGWLEPLVKRQANVSSDLREALDYSTTCLGMLDVELEGQKTRAPQPLHLPSLDADSQERIILALKDLQVRPLRHLVSFSQSPMRAVATNSGGGYCWYELAIPHDLTSVCVLDASLVIRHLPKIGGRLMTDLAFNGDIKTNEKVEVAQLHWRSGRSAMEAAFEAKRENREVSKEVIEVVKTIPEDQAIIVWSFKHRPERRKSTDILSTLKDDLRASGVDLNATVVTPSGPRPRFVFLTWGNETSTNDYAYASNVIMAGVLHRDDIDLAANVLGQKDDLLGDYEDLHAIKKSEVAHCVYQALSRGSCRMIVNGEAMPMKAWIIHHDDTLETTIRAAMPGIRWTEWRPQFVKGAAERKTKKVADALVTYLGNLAPNVSSISTKALKPLVATDATEKVWRQAITVATEVASGWSKVGRSFCRINALPV
jgi:hypothetical protein